MRVAALFLIASAALAATASPLGAQPPGQGAQRARLPAPASGAAAIVDAFHAALNRGDTRGALTLLATDALIFEQGGVERSKAEYAAHHLAADAQFAQAVTTTVTRRIGGGSGTTAWVATEARLTGTYKGKPVDRLSTETMVLRRSGSAWKIVHIHWSSAAKP